MESKVYYVYVLESINHRNRYIGMTQDPKKRLSEHNSGISKFTSSYLPWKIIYQELVGDIKNALQLEKYYKSSAGRRKILKHIPKKNFEN